MKPVLATILAFLYLATSTGATINIHYCMGEIVSHNLAKEEKCGKCGMEKMEGCCEDVVKVVKTTQDNHSFHTPHIEFAPCIAILQANYLHLTPEATFKAPALPTHNNSPPDSSGIPLCILHCVFRL